MATNIRYTESDKYNKPLTLEDRIKIREIISTNRADDGSMTILLNDIAKMLKKDPTTISKEIKKNREFKAAKEVDFAYTKKYCERCTKLKTCPKNHLNDNCKGTCDDFKLIICKHLKKFPSICNGCKKLKTCTLERAFYVPLNANTSYRETLVESRQGISLTTSEFNELDNILKAGIDKGQSVAHIVNSNDLPVSQRTIYTYIKNGYMMAKPIDTRNMVKMRTRGQFRRNSIKYRKAKAGRTYTDYMKYISQNADEDIIQMDTVEGTKGGKVILSLLSVKTHFQYYVLLENKSASNVVGALNIIQDLLGINLYKKVFKTILTDNGTEFSDISGIISDPLTGEIRSNLFYCEPYCSNQKAICENNHRMLRYVLPKGKSFDNLTDEDMIKLNSHINSLKRKSTDYSTPIELFRAFYGDDVLIPLKITPIPPNEVKLNPSLIK